MREKHNVENPNSRSTIDNVYLFLAHITEFWQEIYIRNDISLWLTLKWLRFLSIGRMQPQSVLAGKERPTGDSRYAVNNSWSG